jgi:hypothetical protein
MNIRNKLEYLSLVGLSILAQCVSARPGVCPRVEHLQTPTCKRQTRLETPAEDKHSSLLRTFINCRRKEFYGIGPCGLYYKSFTIVLCNRNDSTIVEPLL